MQSHTLRQDSSPFPPTLLSQAACKDDHQPGLSPKPPPPPPPSSLCLSTASRRQCRQAPPWTRGWNWGGGGEAGRERSRDGKGRAGRSPPPPPGQGKFMAYTSQLRPPPRNNPSHWGLPLAQGLPALIKGASCQALQVVSISDRCSPSLFASLLPGPIGGISTRMVASLTPVFQIPPPPPMPRPEVKLLRAKLDKT